MLVYGSHGDFDNRFAFLLYYVPQEDDVAILRVTNLGKMILAEIFHCYLIDIFMFLYRVDRDNNSYHYRRLFVFRCNF